MFKRYLTPPFILLPLTYWVKTMVGNNTTKRIRGGLPQAGTVARVLRWRRTACRLMGADVVVAHVTESSGKRVSGNNYGHYNDYERK